MLNVAYFAAFSHYVAYRKSLISAVPASKHQVHVTNTRNPRPKGEGFDPRMGVRDLFRGEAQSSEQDISSGKDVVAR